MRWRLAAPFNTDSSDIWLGSFVPGNAHSFQTTPATYVHDRSRRATGARQWWDYFEHGRKVWNDAAKDGTPCGIITLFPQLAITVGLQKASSLKHRKTPVLAYTFNLGDLYSGPKRALAQLALRSVDLMVVHSRQEVDNYARWLGVPQDRFRFVALQRAARPILHAEELAHPFVLSMGSAHRDYRMFFEVMERLGHRTIVVAGAHAIAGLQVPANIEIRSELSLEECDALVQQARVNVVPISNSRTASGQVTLLEAMMFGKATVATRCMGTEDYAEHGTTALLVPPSDTSAITDAIDALWTNADLRASIGRAARIHALATFSDEAAGRSLGGLLDELALPR